MALAPGRLLDVEHVVADPGVRGEVRVDELLRLLAADPGARGQPEVAHAVGQPEVDHLGHRPLVRGDLTRRLVQHPCGRLAVNVGLFRERLLQVLVAGHVGDDPELDLGVVRCNEHGLRRAGHERAPNPPPEWRPYRDVLQVRVGRGEATRRGNGLVEGRVQPPVLGDQRRQRLDIGRAQLGVDAPVEDRLDHRMDAHELLED